MTIKIPLPVGGGDPIQCVTHVLADVLIPVFIERERARGVLYEQVQQAGLVLADLGQFGHHGVGNQVAAAGARGKRELFLEPRHFRRADVRGDRCDGGIGATVEQVRDERWEGADEEIGEEGDEDEQFEREELEGDVGHVMRIVYLSKFHIRDYVCDEAQRISRGEVPIEFLGI